MEKLILLMVVVVISCNNVNEQEDKTQPTITKEDTEKINEQKAIQRLKEKYPSAIYWDSIVGEYSIDYYPALSSGYQLISKGIVTDIFIEDSTKYVSIKNYSYPIFYFDFAITNEQEKILKDNNNRSSPISFIFIVNIDKIKKIKSEVTVAPEDLSFYRGSGKMVEIALIK